MAYFSVFLVLFWSYTEMFFENNDKGYYILGGWALYILISGTTGRHLQSPISVDRGQAEIVGLYSFLRLDKH